MSLGNNNFSPVKEFQKDLHCYQHGLALLAVWAMGHGRLDTGGRLGKTEMQGSISRESWVSGSFRDGESDTGLYGDVVELKPHPIRSIP